MSNPLLPAFAVGATALLASARALRCPAGIQPSGRPVPDIAVRLAGEEAGGTAAETVIERSEVLEHERLCCRCGARGHMGWGCLALSFEKYQQGRYQFGKHGEVVSDVVLVDTGQLPTEEAEEGPAPDLLPPPLGGPGSAAPPPPPPPPPPPRRTAAATRAKVGKLAADDAKLASLKAAADEAMVVDEAKIADALQSSQAAADAVRTVECPRCHQQVREGMMVEHMASHSSEIMPYLFLGGERNAHNHKELFYRTGVGYVLNATWETANFFPLEAEYLRVGISDFSSSDIKQAFEHATAFIDEARSNRSRVLVHCVAGISRSSTLVLQYLMRREGLSLRQAYGLVKARRTNMRPNRGFMLQLMALEKDIFGIDKPTMDIRTLFPEGERNIGRER